MKKSAEGGCSWGQAEYGRYFEYGGGDFVDLDEQLFSEWLEKAANQNNPKAAQYLGEQYEWSHEGAEKAVAFYRVAAELGWERSMLPLARLLAMGVGCERDWREAVRWAARGEAPYFWELLGEAKQRGEEKDGNELNQWCYALGWGLYWYVGDVGEDESDQFTNRCLDYYCACVELQQKSIFTFLWCWNQTVGVKDVGVMIGKMVWEGREDNLVKSLGKH
jgi:TPR repeat protein